MRRVVLTAVFAVLFVVMIGATKAEAATPPATITGVSCRGEWVDIRNTSGATLNLRSFRLHDHDKVNRYDFFRLMLPPGSSVRVWAAGGHGGPYNRWVTAWNRRILADTGDRVTLLNPARKVVSARNCGDAGGPKPPPRPPGQPGGQCHPSYTPCIAPGPSDVDCLGGGGNGPRYVQGPVRVHGSDQYGLDANHDGIGCET